MARRTGAPAGGRGGSPPARQRTATGKGPGWARKVNNFIAPPPDSKSAKLLKWARKTAKKILPKRLSNFFELGCTIGIIAAHIKLAKDAQVERDRKAWARFKRPPKGPPPAPPAKHAPTPRGPGYVWSKGRDPVNGNYVWTQHWTDKKGGGGLTVGKSRPAADPSVDGLDEGYRTDQD